MKKAETIYLEEPEEVKAPDLASPPQGKAWRRKSDRVIYTGPLYLGKRYFENGKKLKTPVQEVAEDFELVDIESS